MCHQRVDKRYHPPMRRLLAIFTLLTVATLPVSADAVSKRALLHQLLIAMGPDLPDDSHELAVFDRHLTEGDIQTALAFFASPAGQHLTAASNELTLEAMKNLEAATARAKQKRSMADMRTIGVVAEAVAMDLENGFPKVNLEAFVKLAVPEYARRLVRIDGWGTEFIYLSDGKAYRVVSAGPDGQFSPDSKTLGAKQGDFGDDLILDTGEFVQPTGTDI